jgi:hypothetical protein
MEGDAYVNDAYGDSDVTLDVDVWAAWARSTSRLSEARL